MKVNNIYFGIFIMFVLLGCITEGEKTVNKNETETMSIRTPIKFIDLSMKNDVLEQKEEKGMLKLFYKLNDTLKISPLDKQKIHILLTLINNEENKNIDDSLRQVIKKELIFSPIKLQDTIKVPFKIIPHFKGKASFKGLISDVYYLNSYTKDNMVRQIEYENFFEKEVFIK